MVTLRYAASSHPGLVRDHNEDAHVAGDQLLAVADGVGGEAAGEIASALAIEAFQALVDGDSPDDPRAALSEAVAVANNAIRDAVRDHSEQRGMATTLTALLFVDDRIEVAHVGDSRAYLWRDDELIQLTRDDSYVQDLVDSGVLGAEEVAGHPYRSVVTKVLQGRPVEPALDTREAVDGDRYLVCSDGLPDAIDDAAIAAALSESAEPDAVVADLVERVLEAGAPDNVTVIVADVTA